MLISVCLKEGQLSGINGDALNGNDGRSAEVTTRTLQSSSCIDHRANRLRRVSKSLKLGSNRAGIRPWHRERIQTRIFHDHPGSSAQGVDQIHDIVVHADLHALVSGDSPAPAFSKCGRAALYFVLAAIFCWTSFANRAEVTLRVAARMGAVRRLAGAIRRALAGGAALGLLASQEYLHDTGEGSISRT